MIEREQLADALSALDARDREVLDYSLRRRVPDEDLSSVFGVEPSEVARMRAGAVERLSAELGVQRGEDLGHMLKLLLETPTWDLLPAAAAPPPPPARAPDAEAPAAGHPPVGAQQHEPPAPQSEPDTTDAREPVLGMLADRPEGESDDSRRRTGRRRLIAGFAVALAVLAPAGMVAALTGSDGDDPPASSASGASGTKAFTPQPEIADPFPTDAQVANRYPVARVRKTVRLLDAPGGRFKVKIGPKTEFGSVRILSVVKRRGEWLAVLLPELDNGEIAWIHQKQVSSFGTVAWAIHVDLSRRVLVLRRDGKKVRTVRIGIGRATNPTPKGRYAVTDKLKVTEAGSPYGCCVLALTGHQTKLPPGWPGGDRLAVHATRDLSGLGKRVSLGCMRTDPRDTRWMLKRIPLGAPVFVRG